MMRYLIDRPVVLTRYPDGIDGKSFYQKNAPDFAPDWIRTVKVWSGGSEREIEYFVCDDEDTLLYLANLGAIVLHVWSSRVETLDKPDWCILDLDPKDAPFTDVVKIARAIHKLCNDIGMPSFVKTSGSTGLHVLLPLGQMCDYEQSRTLGQLIANLIAQEHTDIATVTRNPARRDGKVYVDYVQNGHGRLLVSPFSVRPKPGAPVSTPLTWREVNNKLTIEQHNIRTVPQRLARQKKDPMAGVLEEAPDLVPVLEKLSKLL
jgi:bifunctional non-homologous end joining protein LigD